MRTIAVALAGMLLLAGCLGGGNGDDLDEARAASDPTSLIAGAANETNETNATAPTPFSRTDVFPGTYNTSGDFARTLQQGPYTVLSPQVVQLESALDGSVIEIELHMPDVPAGERVPVIAQASPYYDDDVSPDEFTDENGYAEDHHYGKALLVNYPAHGYALALVAVRGSGGSGGCADFSGPREQADLDQAVTWLGTQPWSNGNVGMMGLSYDGSTAWEVAATGNPHLKTIVPIAGVSDVFGMTHRNGTWAASASATLLYYGFSNTYYRLDPPAALDPERRVEAALCPDVAPALAPTATGALSGERDDGGFWEARNHRPGVEANYRGSIFVVHGFHDLNVPIHAAYPWVDQLAANGTVVKHLLGQWRHTFPDSSGSLQVYNPTPRYDFAEILLHWFDRWLKEDASVDIGPAAQVADSTGRWRSEVAWPPTDAVPAVWHLTPGGGLDRDEPGTTGSVMVGADGADLVLPKDSRLVGPDAPCPTCAVFTTEPMERELRFAGAPRPHLAVTPLGPGGYLTAALYVVDADGEATLLTDGAMDLRFAAGGEHPEPVRPGETITARMELDPVDAAVPERARLVLMVSQGTARDDTAGSEIYMAAPDVPPTPVRVELGASQSVLTVLAFERGPEALFVPPGVGR